jgi:hypothetical protein
VTMAEKETEKVDQAAAAAPKATRAKKATAT